jgi:hypothetical protein
MTDTEKHVAAEIYRHTDMQNLFHLLIILRLSSNLVRTSCGYLAFPSAYVHFLIHLV